MKAQGGAEEVRALAKEQANVARLATDGPAGNVPGTLATSSAASPRPRLQMQRPYWENCSVRHQRDDPWPAERTSGRSQGNRKEPQVAATVGKLGLSGFENEAVLIVVLGADQPIPTPCSGVKSL